MHREIASAVRRFAQERVRPQAAELDRGEQAPRHLFAAMADLGLFGITVPEAHGGAGLDCLAYTIVMEELSRGYASVADQCGLVELLARLLSGHGSEAQRRRWLLPLLRAEAYGAYALTEAEAGSDLAAIRTRAVRNDRGWLLTGAKQWIHNAPLCDFALVLARTEPVAGRRGMSLLMVDCGLPGVFRGPAEHKLGQRASEIGELHFGDVQLPPDAVLGEPGRGFQYAMDALDTGRIGIGALAVGILQAALDAAAAHAKNRRQFGQPIASFQAVQFMIADMAKDLEAARLLVRSAALRMDAGDPARAHASMAKCFATDAAVAHASNAVQIFGGSGTIRGFEVERLFRDAKVTQIYEGTNQIQRMIIAREVMG